MDANTIGGVVNLRLREAPSGLHFDVLSQGNYNSSDMWQIIISFGQVSVTVSLMIN